MIEVENKVPIYEIDGKDSFKDRSVLIVNHHRIRNQFVVIEIGGHRYIVVGSNLVAAIRNAQNVDK